LASVITSGIEAVGHAGEPVAAAPEPGLDLVGDHQDAVPAAALPERRQVSGRRAHDAPLALDRLDHDGGDLVGPELAQGVVEGRQVAVRQRPDRTEERPERRLVLLVRGQRQRPRRLAVVGPAEVDQHAVGSVGAHELDRRLDRLGPGVREEDAAPLVAGRDGPQHGDEVRLDGGAPRRQRLLRQPQVAALAQEALHGLDQGRVALAERDGGVAARVDQVTAVDVLELPWRQRSERARDPQGVDQLHQVAVAVRLLVLPGGIAVEAPEEVVGPDGQAHARLALGQVGGEHGRRRGIDHRRASG
jgi:hypothetical protein